MLVCCCVCLGCADRPSAGQPSTGPPSAGPPKISLFFFPLPPSFSFFFSLWGSSRGILVVFLKAGTLQCARLGSQAVV